MSQSLNGKGVTQILVGAACLAGAWYYGHISSANSESGLEPVRPELQADDLVWNSNKVQAPPLNNGTIGNLTEHLVPAGDLLQSSSRPADRNTATNENAGPMLAPPDFTELEAAVEKQRAENVGITGTGHMSALSRPEPAAPVPNSMALVEPGEVRPWNLAANNPVPPQPVSVLRPMTNEVTMNGLAPLALRADELNVAAGEFKIHVVRPGETLQSLSRQYFGTADYYLDIYAANQDVLVSPAAVRSGTSLRIPAGSGE